MEQVLQKGFKANGEHIAGLLICIAIGLWTSWWLALAAALVMTTIARKRLDGQYCDESDAPPPQPRCHPAMVADKSRGQDIFQWPGSGGFLFELAGESHYQPALRALAGKHGDEEAQADYTATLVVDEDAQDHKAVRVEIGGVVIGFLGGQESRSFRSRVSALKLGGRKTACAARICGGRVNDQGERAAYGVRLDMTPLNQPWTD